MNPGKNSVYYINLIKKWQKGGRERAEREKKDRNMK